MPTLNWIGKEKVVNHHLDVPFHTLNEEYSFGEHSENKIIHADNLLALKSLLPQYEGRIKCIYIDPPYNTGNEGWVYNDNVNDPKIKKWLGQVVGKEAEDLTRHDKWLCMMYPRLKLLHKLLSDDGAIFISIDDNELANLKLIMDEIFGSKNLVEYFSWYKTYSPSNLSNKSKKCLEYIVCYEKNKNNNRYKGLYKINEADNPLIKSNNQKKILRFPKESITCTLEDDCFFKAGIYGTKVNEVILKNDVWFKNSKFEDDVILESKFIWTQENLENEIAKRTKIIFKGKSLAPRYDKANYEPEVPRNLIDSNDYVGTTEEGGVVLKEIFDDAKVFDYPKPPTLIQYLINFSCDKNSIILDSFAGSGTTAHAVLNLNKQDGGNRKFILVEMENYAESITAERVKRVMNGYGKDLTPALSKGEGEIQNASKEVEGTGGGFTYYTLGETVLDEEHNLNAKLALHKIHQYIWYAETHAPYTAKATAEGYLGKFNETGIYFHYTPETVTTLDDAYLMHVKEKAEQYIIYADMCLLSDKFLLKHNIIFKKIPRDISKL